MCMCVLYVCMYVGWLVVCLGGWLVSSSSSQNPAESSAHNASVPDELWAQRDQPTLEDIK